MEHSGRSTPFQLLQLPTTHVNMPMQEAEHPLDSFYFAQHRVSQKLIHNKYRKMEIDCQRAVEKKQLLQKRRKRERQIHEFSLKRQAYAQEQREAHLRSVNLLHKEKQLQENYRHRQRLEKLQASDQNINLCRKRVEEKRNEYIIKIHNKNKEKHDRAHINRQVKQTLADNLTDQVHFDEWKQYQAKIHKKHQGKTIQPDRLYQEHKKKNILIQNIFKIKSHSKENQELFQKVKIYQKTPQLKEQKSLTSLSSTNGLLRTSKRVEYYGVHESDMMKQTFKDITKMRRYIEEHTTAPDPSTDQALVDKFEKYLLGQMLK